MLTVTTSLFTSVFILKGFKKLISKPLIHEPGEDEFRPFQISDKVSWLSHGLKRFPRKFLLKWILHLGGFWCCPHREINSPFLDVDVNTDDSLYKDKSVISMLDDSATLSVSLSSLNFNFLIVPLNYPTKIDTLFIHISD